MPTGYIMFSKKDGNFLGRYLHLNNLRESAVERKLSPEQVIVFRLYDKGIKDEDRKLMFVHEYAFKNKCLDLCGKIQLEVESWTWDAPAKNGVSSIIKDSRDSSTPIYPHNDAEKTFSPSYSKFDYYKFKAKLFVGNITNVLWRFFS